MYRLNFLSFAQGFNNPPEGTAYRGGYTLYTPLSRRLMLITNVPFVLRNQTGGGLPTIDPHGQSVTPAGPTGQTTFGDISFTPRVLLHETQDFSVTVDLTVVIPTGNQPLAGKASLTPMLAFWYNLYGGWVIRGGVGDLISTQSTGGDELISQLAIGKTLTGHDVPWFGDFTFYVSAVANSPLNTGGGSTSASLTPGFRSHLGNDWYFLGGLPVPVTKARVADLGMVFWLMKAW
jgi:hypothetical protein